MQKGYLAFIDILGFRQGIISHNSESYVKNYLDALKYVVDRRMQLKSNELDYMVFSDSIVITSKGNDKSYFDSIVIACSKMLYMLTYRCIPIRGCISYGLFERVKIGERESNVFIAGPALVEAYDIERRQNWIGIILGPSINEKNYADLKQWNWQKEKAIKDNISKYLFRYDKIPLHTVNGEEEYIDGFLVFPKPSLIRRDRTNVEKRFINALDYMRVSSVNASIRKKYYNTLNLFNEIDKSYPNICEEY